MTGKRHEQAVGSAKPGSDTRQVQKEPVTEDRNPVGAKKSGDESGIMQAFGQFWDSSKDAGERIGLPLLLGGFVVLVGMIVWLVGWQPDLNLVLGVAAGALGLISIGLGFISVGLARKADVSYGVLLRRIDRNVARLLPDVKEGDRVEIEGEELGVLPRTGAAGAELEAVPTGVSEKVDTDRSKALAKQRLDEDTKKVGYVRGEIYRLPNGIWGIHWGGKYPL